MTGTTDRDYLYDPTEPPAEVKTAPQPLPGVCLTSYLVTINCAMDDVPVRLFQTEDDALDFIRNNPPYPSRDREHNCPDVNTAYRVIGRDVGLVNGYNLFTLVDGRPVSEKPFFWDDDDNPWHEAGAAAGYKLNGYGQLESNDENDAV